MICALVFDGRRWALSKKSIGADTLQMYEEKTARAMFRPHFLKLCFAHLRFTPASFPTTRENLPSFLRKRGTTAHNFPTYDAPFVDGAFTRSTSSSSPDETHMRREDALARNAHNAHLSRFSIFAFTPSHAHHKQLIHR
jgi:hypothetical protein